MLGSNCLKVKSFVQSTGRVRSTIVLPVQSSLFVKSIFKGKQHGEPKLSPQNLSGRLDCGGPGTAKKFIASLEQTMY